MSCCFEYLQKKTFFKSLGKNEAIVGAFCDYLTDILSKVNTGDLLLLLLLLWSLLLLLLLSKEDIS